MTRFVVDAKAVLELVGSELEVAEEHELLAPTLLRSQTLSLLHEAVLRGELTAEAARARVTQVRKLPIRLLGDAVLLRKAWDLADQLGWETTYAAEYVALTVLQAEALVTADPDLASAVEGIVRTASVEDLLRPDAG